MVDLRDDRTVRASYLYQLLDIEGEDLKKVYEPISDQIGYILCFCLFLMVAYFIWKRFTKWSEESKPQFIPYKVIKPPSSMVIDQKDTDDKNKSRKRVCAVIGGTGFIGSYVVNELVRRKEYYVFVLGRKFRKERTNPDADCHIQVDMLDLDGLVTAFQGVDSVINTAAILPNAFQSADRIYSMNRLGFNNLIKAAKKARVKNFVHLSGYHYNGKAKDPVFSAFINSFYSSEKDFAQANGEDGLHTCVIGPANILGLNSPFLDGIISGQMTTCPMSDKMPTSFLPAEYLATALVNAENKLSSPDNMEEVAGKILQLRGEPMTWKTLLTLPGWPQKISEPSPFLMTILTKINVVCATLFHWAPFGPDLTPGIMEILELVEEDVPEEEVQMVYKVLDVGPPHPPIAEYVKQLVEKYKANNKKEH